MSRADCDRNLLLGILGSCRLNFIDRHALVAAFDRWTSDKTRPLGDILVELGKLDSPHRELLGRFGRCPSQVAQRRYRKRAWPPSARWARSERRWSRLADPDVQSSLAGAAMCVPDGDPAADAFATHHLRWNAVVVWLALHGPATTRP